MSSINPHFTFHYSQPEDYRFSHDSVFLAREVFERVRQTDISSLAVLDLCAGCGIVGLDFLFHCRKELGVLPQRCDFLEIQEIYREHFERNARELPHANTRFILGDFTGHGRIHERYDLILANPPYFRAGEGSLSKCEFKNRCRFFLDSTFEQFATAVENLLAPGGRAFALVRLSPTQGMKVVGEIRGTKLVEIQKI